MKPPWTFHPLGPYVALRLPWSTLEYRIFYEKDTKLYRIMYWMPSHKFPRELGKCVTRLQAKKAILWQISFFEEWHNGNFAGHGEKKVVRRKKPLWLP